MFAKYKKIILIITIAIVGFFIYSFFFGTEKNDSLLTSTSNTPSGADVIGSEIIQALNQIESLQLSRAIFEDPVYRSLVDRSQPIPAEPLGRENPFAPITVISGSGAVVNIQEARTPTTPSSQSSGAPRPPQN